MRADLRCFYLDLDSTTFSPLWWNAWLRRALDYDYDLVVFVLDSVVGLEEGVGNDEPAVLLPSESNVDDPKNTGQPVLSGPSDEDSVTSTSTDGRVKREAGRLDPDTLVAECTDRSVTFARVFWMYRPFCHIRSSFWMYRPPCHIHSMSPWTPTSCPVVLFFLVQSFIGL